MNVEMVFSVKSAHTEYVRQRTFSEIRQAEA